MYYPKREYRIVGYRKAATKNKMYDAVLQHKDTDKKIKVPFGDSRYSNFQDKTGLNLYPKLVTGNRERRRLYRIRHAKDVWPGFYSPGYFAMTILW